MRSSPNARPRPARQPAPPCCRGNPEEYDAIAATPGPEGMNAQREPFDVIVVGGGGSGLAAAYRIAELGGRVLVLEKQPQRGLDRQALTASVAAFNRYVVGEQPDPFGRQGDPHLLERVPWVLLGPAKAYFTT